jgi:hypothetical protein
MIWDVDSILYANSFHVNGLYVNSLVRSTRLTNASPGLRMSKIFKLDLGADFRPRLLEPCQERLASAVKVGHCSTKACWRLKVRNVVDH